MPPSSQPTSIEAPLTPTPAAPRLSRRMIAVLAVSLALVLLAVLPPLLSLSRYQRRIAISMADVLGRPVHLDRVTLKLLPLPSFSIENLVIDEAPAFGAEPIIRAATVDARLRVSSLWRRRVEFSRITFTDPSVNLVRRADGRWNLESVLLQASRVDAAPTAQSRAGAAPRFPYIEATGARINFKSGPVKTPFSLTDADFALWLPQPRQWKMRIHAHPTRTDISPSNTGTVQVEATIDRASTLRDVPLTLAAAWNDAPLGGTSRVLTGSDAGVRGNMNLSVKLGGTLGAASLGVRLQLDGVHRADFAPEQSLAADIECSARAFNVVHTLEDLRCASPAASDKVATVAMTGTIPDTLHLRSAQVQIGTPRLSAEALLLGLRALSSHVPPDLKATGSLAASVMHSGRPGDGWEGHAEMTGLALSGGTFGEQPLLAGPLALHTAPPELVAPSPRGVPRITLEPVSLALGGPAPATLDGTIDASGYTLRLNGQAALPRLLALAAMVPQFGEGLVEMLPKTHGAGPIRLDLLAHRDWGGPQIWMDATVNLPPLVRPTLSRRPPPHSRRPAIR